MDLEIKTKTCCAPKSSFSMDREAVEEACGLTVTLGEVAVFMVKTEKREQTQAEADK